MPGNVTVVQDSSWKWPRRQKSEWDFMKFRCDPLIFEQPLTFPRKLMLHRRNWHPCLTWKLGYFQLWEWTCWRQVPCPVSFIGCWSHLVEVIMQGSTVEKEEWFPSSVGACASSTCTIRGRVCKRNCSVDQKSDFAREWMSQFVQNKMPSKFYPLDGCLRTSLGDVFYHRQLYSWLGHQLYHAARFRWAWKMQGVDVSDFWDPRMEMLRYHLLKAHGEKRSLRMQNVHRHSGEISENHQNQRKP